MLKVSNSFKQKMKRYGKQLNVLVEFGNTIIDKTIVKKVEFSYNGDILTSVMRMVTLEIENYDFVDASKLITVKQLNEMKVQKTKITRVRFLTADLDKIDTVKEVHTYKVSELTARKVRHFRDKEQRQNIKSATQVNLSLGVKLLNDEDYEYVDYGTFKVFDIEEIVDTNSVKLYLYDYLIETHINYDLNLIFPMTVAELLQAICNRFDFVLLTTEFTNSTQVIEEDKYINLNYTFRDVLDEIAEVSGGFIKIWGNQVSVCYPKDTGEIIDEYDLDKLKVSSKVGTFNTVVLGRSPQEDNIYYPEGIEDSNRVAIRIDNNQIMDRNRESYIVNLYNQLNGFEYTVFELSSYGFGYFEFGDIATLKDLKGNEYKTIFFNIVINIDSGIKEKVFTEATNYSETKYEYATSIEKRLTNTEIITNKQQNQIKLLIEQTGETSNKINSITMDLDSTELKIQNIENDTNEQISSLKQTIEGLTNTVSDTGGNNVFCYSKEYYEGNIEEVFDTEVKQNSSSKMGYYPKVGTATQIVQVMNGFYTVSFKYKKKVPMAVFKVELNDVSYNLIQTDYTEFVQTIEVTANTIKLEFITDTDNSALIMDLMGNIGNVKSTWSQNANETITDTVKIGKGIQVDSSSANTYHRIDADGNRTYNKATGEIVSQQTDKGTETAELVVRDKAQIVGMLVQKVESQVWLSNLL